MERKATKIILMTLGLLYCLSFMMPAAAFSWNQATHAYIADRLSARTGHDNLDVMWGSVMPDFFNYVFDPTLCSGWVSDQTHGTYFSDSFLKAWNAADTNSEHALAYGFVSHDQAWGADFTAHISCRTCGQNDGYIIMKAWQLLNVPLSLDNPLLTYSDAFAGLGMSPEEALLVAHVITEYAIDIMLGKEVDPLLGRKLATAARNVTKRFQPLLVKAFAADYAAYCFDGDGKAAANVLTAAEKGHRKDMIFLGQAISQSERVAEHLMAEQLVAILPGFLGSPLPVPEEAAVEIVRAAIFSSMAICKDYKAEIDATVEFVDESLKDHGIFYSGLVKPQNGR